MFPKLRRSFGGAGVPGVDTARGRRSATQAARTPAAMGRRPTAVRSGCTTPAAPAAMGSPTASSPGASPELSRARKHSGQLLSR